MLLFCFLLSLLSFNQAISFDSLKQRAQEFGMAFEHQATAGSTCQVTSDSFYQQRVATGSCSKAAKSTCNICGPSSVQVPQGGSIIVQYTVNCTYSGWSNYQSWGSTSSLTVSPITIKNTPTLTFNVTAQPSAKIGDTTQFSATWCLTGGTGTGFAGIATTATVVAGTVIRAVAPTTTLAPTTTPATTPATTLAPVANQCPVGYTSGPSELISPALGSSWCPGTSQAQVCTSSQYTYGAAAQLTLNFNFTVACSPIKTNSYVVSVPNGATLSNLPWSNNLGSSWTLIGTERKIFGVLNVTSEWCCPDGYAVASALDGWEEVA